MTIDSPITAVKGVGEELAKKFAGIGVRTVGDLIACFPRRYEDYSVVAPIRTLRPGPVTVRAVIKQVKGRYVQRGMHITEAVASDETDSVRIVWFNQPYREGGLKPGQEYFISGIYELSRQRFAIMNPSAELVSEFPVSTARIIPVYRETKGLTSKHIRRIIREVAPIIQTIPESLPAWLLAQQRLVSRAQALAAIHYPHDSEALQHAKHRLGFEEVFVLTLSALLTKYELLKDNSVVVPFNESLARQFVGHLPFSLTNAQRKVVWQIYQDMQKPSAMNRLVEGDVGSGKTVVAAMAALMCLSKGYQVAFMAPTELLARQHAETIYKLLHPLRLHDKVTSLVGGMKPKEKELAREHIATGRAQFIVGTHALIQEAVDMHKLGLVIIDEQHRFGVEQRKKLLAKAGHMPHLLSLTATPIPRSLALTLYGELDVSVLDAKPAGRQPIETAICSPNSRAQLYEKITKELQTGRQMFVVCPLISPQSGQSGTEGRAVSSAEKIYNQFRIKDFKGCRIGLLHGKMKPAEKNETMERFVSHELDILVSTTVIEVGVDVPNASIMLIEAADRFGLAQIHQLRGRVGRGGHKGYCYLMMSDSKSPPQRLRALERINDGFKLAELDLQLRGPGAIYGTLQHGALDLRIAKLTDTHLIASARQAAQNFIDRGEDLVQYPVVLERVTKARAVTNLN
ncbi:MAG TPA: ATP-dependent DNA helicase RecG [Candidatus Saccharimonadales bacterium]|nr:ATP-dependent DNA helicase RecG [Candidatus Saccharimonadales bacterium]